MLNQLLSLNQEMNKKDVEIANLRLENDQLNNNLRSENEFIERLNKPKEAIRNFKELMRT